MKNPFLPRSDSGRGLWLSNFATQLGTLAASLGITPAEATATQADSDYFNYIIDAANKFKQYGVELTAYKNRLRDGPAGAAGAMPATPVLAAPPPPVPFGIFPRAGAFVQRAKASVNYSDPVAQALGAVGADIIFDPSSMKPQIKVRLGAGGRPEVLWQKNQMDAIDIYVDRTKSGTFVFLATDTIPDYPDTADLPAPGVGAVWTYKGIYRMNDQQVGQWSDPVSIAVMGQ